MRHGLAGVDGTGDCGPIGGRDGLEGMASRRGVRRGMLREEGMEGRRLRGEYLWGREIGSMGRRGGACKSPGRCLAWLDAVS